MRRPILYIAGPYTDGDVAANVRHAIMTADLAYRRGWLPFCPHLSHFWHLLIPHPYTYWTTMDLEWLDRADAFYRIPGPSSGADIEESKAQQRGIPCYVGEMPEAEEMDGQL